MSRCWRPRRRWAGTAFLEICSRDSETKGRLSVCQTNKRTALFDILKVALPPAEAAAALEALLSQGPDIVLFDALYEQQLRSLGKLIDHYASVARPLFSVGSSGVEMALGAHWAAQGRLQPMERWTDPGPAEPLLVASGSCSPVTERQIALALANGFAEVGLATAALAAEEDVTPVELRAAEQTVKHLNAGRSVIVHTSRGNEDPRIAPTTAALVRRGLDATAAKTASSRLFGGALGRIIREVIGQAPVRRICIAGGDTSGYVAQALGVEALEMIAPMVMGAPLCRAHAPSSPADGLELNFKGGQVGGPDYFGFVARGRA